MNTLTIILPIEHLNTCTRAVKFHSKPRRWHLSEYAMTKTTAERALGEITQGQAVELFDADCLLGELARLARHDKTAVDAFMALRSVLNNDPLYRRITARDKAIRAAQKKQRRLERRAEKLAARIHAAARLQID